MLHHTSARPAVRPAALLLALLAATPGLSAQQPAAAAPAPAPAAGEQAAEWLRRAALNQGKPVILDVAVAMRASGVATDMQGHFEMADDDHFRGRAAYTTDLSAVGAGKETVEMNLLADGSHIWVDSNHPQAGRQVFKQTLADMRKMQQRAGAAGMQPGDMDFAAQLQQMGQWADLQLESVQNGRVRLQGPLNDAGRKALEQPRRAATIERLAVVLDQKTAYPLEIELGGGATPFLLVKLSNVSFPEHLDPATFVFTAPEGVRVAELPGAPRGGSSGPPGGGMAPLEQEF